MQIELRGRDGWRGNYQQVLDLVWNGTEEVGTGASPRENLKFFSVATNELDKATQNQQLLWFVIPTSWLSLDGRYLLYPPHLISKYLENLQTSGKVMFLKGMPSQGHTGWNPILKYCFFRIAFPFKYYFICLFLK